ncbi:MAG: acyltransferase [Anaerolineales bacterium]|nr:acyltransferase [Anaerolineales bacterium]
MAALFFLPHPWLYHHRACGWAQHQSALAYRQLIHVHVQFCIFGVAASPILIFVHLWSISYEEQFYAAIPWLTRKLASAAQNTRTNWFIFLFGMGCVIRALFIQFRVHPAAIYFLPITHFESLLGGIALGLGILEPILTRFKTRTLWVTVLALTSSIFILPNNNVTEWGLMLTYLCVGAFTTLLLYVLITQPYSPITRFVGNSLFTQLGKISYGLYIFHFGCFMLAASIVDLSLKVQQPVLPLHTLLILCIAFALTIIFASISYRFIEKPALSLKRKFSALPTGLK